MPPYAAIEDKRCYPFRVHALKARIENGRYVIDEPADLPDGTELYLLPSSDAGDIAWANEAELTSAEREKLEAALERGSADIAAGRTIDAREFLAKLPSS